MYNCRYNSLDSEEAKLVWKSSYKVPCGSSMKDCPETSGNRPRRFPTGFQQISSKNSRPTMTCLTAIMYIAENASYFFYFTETCRKPPRLVFEGLRRFLEVSRKSFSISRSSIQPAPLSVNDILGL